MQLRASTPRLARAQTFAYCKFINKMEFNTNANVPPASLCSAATTTPQSRVEAAAVKLETGFVNRHGLWGAAVGLGQDH